MTQPPIDLAAYRARRDLALAIDQFEATAYRAVVNGSPAIARHIVYHLSEIRAELARAIEHNDTNGGNTAA